MGLVKVGLRANSSWFRFDLAPVYGLISSWFTIRLKVGLGVLFVAGLRPWLIFNFFRVGFRVY